MGLDNMGREKKVLAFDYGASSGRGIIGTYNGKSITLKEIHRFSNDPVMLGKSMYWDILRLYYEMKQGMIKANLSGGFDSVGVDTWGVDFGLIDKDGKLLENPIHYRDARTEGMLSEGFYRIKKERFYEITGNQFMEINTAFQLLSIILKRPEVLERADKALLMPDLFDYFLTGKKNAEYSIASTTQLLDAKKKTWSYEVMDALQIPNNLFPDVIPSGTVVGKILPEICDELGLSATAEVIAVAGHDTQCAMISVPTQKKDFIFISCGTWSLFGTELDEPYIQQRSAELNITNEGGYGGKTSFLKNIIGLWLIQESRRQWGREGKDLSFSELEKRAEKVAPFMCFIDTDATEFVAAGNIPEKIQKYCERTKQHIPQTEGEIVRCINQSLAMKYRKTIEEIEECTGKNYSEIHMVGGGIQSHMLCQLTANACGRRVYAGPIEATVYGNIALQLLALGAIKDIQEAREVISASEQIMVYDPKEEENWMKAYAKYQQVLEA